MSDERADRRGPVIPPPGARLDFHTWAKLIADDVRRRVPDVVATARGRQVMLRLGDRTAVLTESGSDRLITFSGASMSSLMDQDRGDAFTARNIAKSIAGFFDAEQSRPDRA